MILRIALVALTAAGTTFGQEVAGPPSTVRRPFDAVVAIIGDRVILRSTLDRELDVQAGGMQLDREQRRELQQRIVHDMARAEIWVQHGKSIGERSPIEFEESLEKMVDAQLRREIRESGSVSSLEEELGLIGSSWADRRRRERSRILEQFGRGDAITKLRRHQGLMVTPAEMRRYYDEHLELFQREASVDVAWVSFRVEGNVEDTRQRVLEAKKAWQTEGLTSKQVAERFEGNDLGTKTNIRQAESDDRARFLKDFAADATPGQVSDPIQRGGGRSFSLLKAIEVRGAKSQAFADPDVQAQIRQRLATQQISSWQNQVLLRKQRRIYVWPPTLNLER